MPTVARRATFPTAAAARSRPAPFMKWRWPNCRTGSQSSPAAATRWFDPANQKDSLHAAALFLSDGLFARPTHRVDGGRPGGALSPRASLDQEGAGGRQRLLGNFAEGRGAGAGAGERRQADRKSRGPAIHRRPQTGARTGAATRRSRSLSVAVMDQLHRHRDPQGILVSDLLVQGRSEEHTSELQSL